MSLKFCEELTDWYWKWGHLRGDKYALSFSEWVNELYDVREALGAAAASAADKRPALAIWGPSQTGKSTSLIGYLDRHAMKTRTEGEDGKNSAFYWPGGTPCYFMMPMEYHENPPAWAIALNPFRQGKDGSAVLSRFTLGSLTPTEGFHHIHDSAYPVEVKLLSRGELLVVLARGYDTECRGPGTKGEQTIWTVDLFTNRVARVKEKFPRKPGKPDPKAFEALRELCQALDSMVDAGLFRYKQLSAMEAEQGWKSLLNGLIDDPQLIGNLELVEVLAADLLWDSVKPITDAYRSLTNALVRYEQIWGARTICCDLPTAAIFLDMGSVEDVFSPAVDGGTVARSTQIAAHVRSLSYKVEQNRVLLGARAGSNRLGLSAEEYGYLQGLILELVFPLNPDFIHNLDPATQQRRDNALKTLLRKADLLDFPGVGNDSNSPFTRIEFGQGSDSVTTEPPTGFPHQERNPKYSPQLLFDRIVKRGKTSTLVSAYSKKLKIDGFSIFLALDRNPPAKPSELHEGIKNWWKHSAPQYNQSGRSPLPLNCVLLWWSLSINQASAAMTNFMSPAKWQLEPVGPIGKPETATIFALNYHRIAGGRGRVHEEKRLEEDSFFVRGIRGDSEFKRIFGPAGSVGYESFHQMLKDRDTGGAEYFFEQLCSQIEHPVLPRADILRDKIESAEAKLKELLGYKELFPEPELIDRHKINLETFRQDILAAAEGMDESGCEKLNHLLREALNVDYRTLKLVPTFASDVTPDFLKAQLQGWISSQCQRVEAWRKAGRKGTPDWSLLGFDAGDKLRNYLDSITASIELQVNGDLAGGKLPEGEESVVIWLQKLVRFNSNRQVDLRRLLAIRLGNLLVYGKEGPPALNNDLGGEITVGGGVGFNQGERKGVACPSYRHFVAPFAGKNRKQPQPEAGTQLRWLVDQKAKPILREPQPGDAELRKICIENGYLPANV